MIDRTYPLENAVEAHPYVEAGHKTGNVVLTLAEGGPLMFMPDLLFEAHQHTRQLHVDAASERLRPRPTRHLLAEALRGAANRLDPRPIAVPLNCSQQ